MVVCSDPARRSSVSLNPSTMADTLMLTGVLAFCPDCRVETVFVAPEVEDADPAERSCTRCGAAVYAGPPVSAAAARGSRIA
jgi:hypothetical protein